MGHLFKFLFALILFNVQSTDSNSIRTDFDEAKSSENTESVTVKVGQQAILPCFINNLGSDKVIWTKQGDILTLGSIKINSDTRLNMQHRYVSEWHLTIDNVVTDDEGEYVCKTNGGFFKVINLQVLMPPTINDFDSTPAGTITLKEGSTITLKCFADAKPDPIIKWYRWNKYKHMMSDKEELEFVGNELVIASIKRTDANMYECIARNSVPPATSRIFNIEIHFLPTVELEVRKTFQFLHRKFSLECKITSNPLDKVYWYKNGMIYSPDEHISSHKSSDTQQQSAPQDDSSRGGNVRVNKYDISNINEYYKLMLTLTVFNAFKEDFGEYQCCAVNVYGQICSNIFVQELKHSKEQEHHGEQKPTQSNNNKASSTSLLEKLFSNEDPANVKPYSSKSLSKEQSPQSHGVLDENQINNIYLSDETSSNRNEIKKIQNTNEQDDLFYDETNESSNKNRNDLIGDENDLSNDDDEDSEDDTNLDDINSADSKDKRRHYLIKSKQLADSEPQSAASNSLTDFILINSILLTFSVQLLQRLL